MGQIRTPASIDPDEETATFGRRDCSAEKASIKGEAAESVSAGIYEYCFLGEVKEDL